jgi:hypothetical protein
VCFGFLCNFCLEYFSSQEESSVIWSYIRVPIGFRVQCFVYSARYCCQILIKFEFSRQIFDKYSNVIYFLFFIFIVSPCILKIHLLSHTNKCTNYIIYYLKSVLIVDIKTLSYFHSSSMFRHITCHPQGALMFLAKITGKTIFKTWTYIVWSLWQHIMNSRVHACSVCYCAIIYVHVLQIVLPVILAWNMSAHWGWHVICRNM